MRETVFFNDKMGICIPLLGCVCPGDEHGRESRQEQKQQNDSGGFIHGWEFFIGKMALQFTKYSFWNVICTDCIFISCLIFFIIFVMEI
jgi:hypothetical protein